MAAHCAICFNQGKVVDFVTVVNGLAVCADHEELASQPGFDIFRMFGGGKTVQPL